MNKKIRKHAPSTLILAPCSTCSLLLSSCVFFFNDTATTEIYTLSLHDALPIYALLEGDEETPARAGDARLERAAARAPEPEDDRALLLLELGEADRKSTRLNSSHGYISYAVFCLKKKNTA